MSTANSRRARQLSAGVVLAGFALLVPACGSSASSPAATTASAPAGSPVPISSLPSGAASAPAAVPSSAVSSNAAVPSASPSSVAAGTGSSTFLAEGQDINGTALHEPACSSGCPLSGDSTAILSAMTWSVWSATEATGTGIYKLDDCNPNCAAGVVSNVATVVTLSQPVKVCSAAGTRWFWSKASFTFPKGLPKSLQGDGAPQNPWVFSNVVTAAQQSCHS
jgi:hypothetical protein